MSCSGPTEMEAKKETRQKNRWKTKGNLKVDYRTGELAVDRRGK